METSYLYIFQNGGVIKKRVKLLPDRYVVSIDENLKETDEPIPIEDYSDYLLTKEDLTDEQAFEQYIIL